MPSPDLIRTVSIPCARAFFAIAPSLPCEEWLRYQIHIPSPASGFFAFAGPSARLGDGPAAQRAGREGEDEAAAAMAERGFCVGGNA